MLNRFKARLSYELIEPSSSPFRSSRVKVSGDFLGPDESGVHLRKLAGELLRGGDGRLTLNHFSRGSAWELPFVKVVKLVVRPTNFFVDLDSSEGVDKSPIARRQHCASAGFKLGICAQNGKGGWIFYCETVIEEGAQIARGRSRTARRLGKREEEAPEPENRSRIDSDDSVNEQKECLSSRTVLKPVPTVR